MKIVYRYFEPSIHDVSSWMLGSKYLYTCIYLECTESRLLGIADWTD